MPHLAAGLVFPRELELAHEADEFIGERCPFKVNVIENMKKAVEVFGK